MRSGQCLSLYESNHCTDLADLSCIDAAILDAVFALPWPSENQRGLFPISPRHRIDAACLFRARKLTGAKYSGKIDIRSGISAFSDALQSLRYFHASQEQRNFTADTAP
jgi:hypothetical protein